MRRLCTTLAISALVALMATGCGGSKKKGASAGGTGLEGGAGGPVIGSAGGPVADDQSTGSAVPTGPGEAAPEQHEMNQDAKGIYNEGVRAGAAGNLAEAERAFKRAVEIDPRAYQALYNLGVLCERQGDDAGARSYYGQAIAAQSDYLAAITAAARLEMRLGDVGAALRLMQEKATAYPKNVNLLNRYADTLIAAQRYTDAIDVAKQALRLDERSADAMLRVAKANVRIGRHELAMSIFDQVLAINPEMSEVYFLRSQIKLSQGNKAEAITDLETTLAKNPYNIEAMNNLATLYILSGNYAQAIGMLERAIGLSPSWAILHLNLGNALRGAGRWKDARVELERSRALDSRFSSALFNMGILYYTATELDGLDKLGRLGEAKRYFAQYSTEMGSKLAKDDPVGKYMKEVLVEIEREERRIQQAKEQAEAEAQRAKEREAAEAAKAKAEAEGAGKPAEEGGKPEPAPEDEGWE
ncbi:MAG: tetratricopeptide repeat protein [Proteobacteria bacterium]|jgi:tetratricopeptide (TPR) repeat protein|nr:tetratricopeptide repeat protein [Pseudomonadota bacterium]